MSCCACCCFYPKYKRRVDNIYPRNLDLPLIKAEVDKLQYYAKIHPEKLSKIGEYLYQNLKWGLSGTYKNKNYVKNTVEAVDKILLVITPQDLNYYAGNYLKIVKKLLEQVGASTISTSNSGGLNAASNNKNTINNKENASSKIISESGGGGASNTNNNNESLEYQKMAAMLFQKFCEKEAANLSTTSYNLNYDTFVCQFSSMCYNNNKDEKNRAEIRSSGLQCLATMVKRLVPDDSLRASYLWDNMDKIVPALLFIMHETFLSSYKPTEIDQSFDVDEEIEQLSRYLYGDYFFLNTKTKTTTGGRKSLPFAMNGNSNDEDQVVMELESVRVGFSRGGGRKSPLDNLNSNETNPLTSNRSNQSSSEASTPNEHSVIMSGQAKLSIGGGGEMVDPDHEAKMLLRNLASKADYTTISKIVMPILAYLDDNKPCGWEYYRYVHCIFLILMYNVKQQHAIVIKELIKHLDSHRNSSAQLKCHIIKAISICIRISAMHSIGTTGQIIEIFTNFLKHLNFSVEKAASCKMQLISKKPLPPSATNVDEIGEQEQLQREIIAAMGQFTSHLPDYSKNDVIMLIARQINSQQVSYVDLAKANNESSNQSGSVKDQLNCQLRSKYFECLIEICMKYKPTQLFSAFSGSQFLEDILKLTLVNDWSSRRKAHEILHQLLDKYQIISKIRQLKPNLFLLDSHSNVVTIKSDLKKSVSSIPKANESRTNLKGSTSSLTTSATKQPATTTSKSQTYLGELNLSEKGRHLIPKEDIHFMRRYGRTFMAYLNESLFLVNNRRENFESIYLTTCLFLIGLYQENEFLVDLVKFGFHIQELALLNHEQQGFSVATQCQIHKFLCAYFLLVSKSSGLDALDKYANEIGEMRKKKSLFRFVYPEYILVDQFSSSSSDPVESSSSNQSFTEMETEFKKELTSAAKNYFELVSNSDQDQETNGKEVVDGEDKIDLTRSSSVGQLPPWLFDKKLVGDILEKANFSTAQLYAKTNDFSLSVAYIQQTQTKIQSILKYRCPYSNSYESISAFNPTSEQQQVALPMGSGSSYNLSSEQQQQHQRFSTGNRGATLTVGTSMNHGLGISPSMNQFVSTPRRSLDVESQFDDDTSYDSASQISAASNYDLDFITQQKLFLPELNQQMNGGGGSSTTTPTNNEPSQLTINSLNLLKQQYLMQQQYQDMTSFESIKRVLFNGGAGFYAFNGSNMSNSGVGSNGIEETTLVSQLNNGGNEFGNIDDSSVLQQHEKNVKIISDFKQKPFDELRQSLQRSNNQSHEKYQQVFDLISKEVNSHTNISLANLNSSQANPAANSSTGIPIITVQKEQSTNAITTSGNVSITNANYLNSINTIGASSLGNMNNYANTSVSSLSNQSSSMGSSAGMLYNNSSSRDQQQQQQQKMVPLNDIEFPQLFMY